MKARAKTLEITNELCALSKALHHDANIVAAYASEDIEIFKFGKFKNFITSMCWAGTQLTTQKNRNEFKRSAPVFIQDATRGVSLARQNSEMVISIVENATRADTLLEPSALRAVDTGLKIERKLTQLTAIITMELHAIEKDTLH